ncbi:unnamed protein product [Parascedosporium putredinis]|uniref:RWD domain-containing protein n=1 Tax=Parascedosporium putredinis TaxID=1442378 RepID=A0A9P1M6S5_9PEZI|nr:unnamed protein product [Parascedosporium putredinis]CAI7987446.1 unnamed protein product [Parascedosporium putredinis]
MSAEIQDEVEALNSIYGPETLVPAEGGGGGGADADDPPTSFILHLPGDTARSSLRLVVPASYPLAPPEVHSTFSTGQASRATAAAELRLFRHAVATVFQPGMPCLFDAVEELSVLMAAEPLDVEPAAEYPPAAAGGGGGGGGAVADVEAEVDYASLPPPPWTLSAPFTEQRSTFLARVAPVSSPAQAASYVQHLLATDRRVRQATHNMTAWRIRGPGGTSFQDCDDDGEAAAGSRLLHLMQAMDLWDVMVVVSRWYGGLKLGPRRFALINQTARDGFVKAGYVKDAADDKKKKSK